MLLTPKGFVSERCRTFHLYLNLFGIEDRQSRRVERPAWGVWYTVEEGEATVVYRKGTEARGRRCWEVWREAHRRLGRVKTDRIRQEVPGLDVPRVTKRERR
jgi:hypothetical protein